MISTSPAIRAASAVTPDVIKRTVRACLRYCDEKVTPVWNRIAEHCDRRRKVYVINRHRTMICCTMRDDDLLRMERYFELNDYRIVDRPEIADHLILNTCAFDKEREDVCIDLIEEFRGYPGELIVTGCVGKISEDRFAEVFAGKYVAAPALNAELDGCLESISHPFERVEVHGGEKRLYDGGKGWRTLTRPGCVPKVGAVKVVNGCPQQCSFCTHRLAIGFKARSVPIDRIIRTIERQVAGGAEVIQLLGDNLGPYGTDINSNVPALVRQLADRFPRIQFALDQYHAAYFVRDYPRGLCELIAEGRIYELKMPLQSGSERILKLMKRSTKLDALAKYIKEAAQLAPDMLFVTHVITGFPTETEEDFQMSVDYVKDVFGHNCLVYLFPCSVHPDTLAAQLEPQVEPDVALDRAKRAERAFLDAGIDVCLDHMDVLKERGLCKV
jgi:tRNA A37 methylthiotransferase MiaB